MENKQQVNSRDKRNLLAFVQTSQKSFLYFCRSDVPDNGPLHRCLFFFFFFFVCHVFPNDKSCLQILGGADVYRQLNNGRMFS